MICFVSLPDSFSVIRPYSFKVLHYQPSSTVLCRQLHSITEMQTPVLCNSFPNWSIQLELERLVVGFISLLHMLNISSSFFAGEIVARAPRSSLVGNPPPKGPCTHQYSNHRFDFFVVYLLSTQRGRCSTWIHASRPTGELSSSVDPKLSVLIPDVFLNGTEHFQLDGADIGKYPTTITGRVCSCPTRTAARLPP